MKIGTYEPVHSRMYPTSFAITIPPIAPNIPPKPTTDPDEFAAAVLVLSAKLERDRAVRLIGVRAEMPDPE